MAESDDTVMFATESLRLVERTPATTVLRGSSRHLGWKTILVDDLETHGTEEQIWDGYSTPDVKITVSLSGAFDLLALINGHWSNAVICANCVNVIGSCESVRIRWRDRNKNASFRVASACLPRG
ncbi:hypothetical protein [Enterovirga sp. CN4-39]|uniref:hypothetical protein n=1 Tax=Enterovirga sp. CN4-39 TaxID=3400910 RepID=UPI003C0AF63B